MKKSVLLVLAALICAFISTQAEAALYYGLTFTSDPGSFVGRGWSFDSSDLKDYNLGIVNYGDSALHANVRWTDEAGPHSWYLELAAPDNVRLETGLTYEGATRWPFMDPGEPGISFSGEGRCSNAFWGWFKVLDVEYSQWGYPWKIAVDFAIYDTIYYEGGPPDLTAGLYGQFRYNTETPFNPVPLGPSGYYLLFGLLGMGGFARFKAWSGSRA